jgi:gamma-glutamyltranspeptidase/glutathione hydrolase
MTRKRRTLALATPHSAATDAGRAAFADGGTAVDAALAACATLTVVYPHMCSLGGDAIALVHAPDGIVTCVNGSGAAPAALDAARVRAALERDPAPVTRTGMPQRGPHTVTVPGVLAAWETLRGSGARHDLARLLRPAIEDARDGCAVSRSLAGTLAWEPGVFATDPGLRDVFFRGGRPRGGGPGHDPEPLCEGDVFRQPALAASLETLARHGVAAFYEGALGGDFVAGLRALGSLMTVDDLARHATDVCAPLRHAAFGHEFLTAPPNSQGYVLLQLLAAMELFAVEAESQSGAVTTPSSSPTPSLPPDPFGPAAGALARLFRLASDERDRRLCDPRVHDVPLDELLSPSHARALARRAGAFGDAAHDGPDALTDGPVGTPGTGPQSDPAAGDTIACVAADSDGWGVSVIQSLYNGFGAAILEPSTGIVAHDRGACFSLDPDSPNVVAGGKRPLHTLMPVMVRRQGRLTIVAGTMGGEAQPQIHAQILSRLLRGADAETTRATAESTPPGDLAGAVAAPRWIYDEGELWAEAGVPAPCLDTLRGTDMSVTVLDDLDETIGHAQYVFVGEEGPKDATSDPRSDGSSVVTAV